MPKAPDLPASRALYRTPSGIAYVGDSLDGMTRHLEDGSVKLFMTSPPYALHRKKEYGNKAEDEYVKWFADFATVMHDKLADDGSLVIDLGGAWKKGRPARSLYQFKLLIHLCEELGDKNFQLAQEFYWYNPSKMPLPAQWVNVDRIRVKDSVNVIWWLAKDGATVDASNRRILKPYSPDMEGLLKRQSYNGGRRPGGARVNDKTWKRRHEGAIPSNVIEGDFSPAAAEAEDELIRDNFLRHGGSESASRYHRAFNALEREHSEDPDFRERARKHPARFPPQVPELFIKFLTNEGDLVADPFGGSNVTGQVAEDLGRSWRTFELHQYYLEPSLARFDSYVTGTSEWFDDTPPLLDAIPEAKYAAR